MARLRHLKVPKHPYSHRAHSVHWRIACSPGESIKSYGGKRATEDVEQVTCKECLEVAAELVERQLFRYEETKVQEKDPLSKFDISLGARVKIT